METRPMMTLSLNSLRNEIDAETGRINELQATADAWAGRDSEHHAFYKTALKQATDRRQAMRTIYVDRVLSQGSSY
jgi:hypothetical protein